MSDETYLPATFADRLDARAKADLALYLDQLIAWNKVLNLSGFDNREKIVRELIVDSFYLADFLSSLFPDVSAPETVDLGAGAGLPGIPLRMLWHAGQYVMVEAREKRALFLSNILSRLKLPATSVFRGRAENFFADSDKKPDCILSRAFMPWPKLSDFCFPWLSDRSCLIVMSNRQAPTDLKSWSLYQETSYQIQNRTRYLWAMRKKNMAVSNAC